MWLIKKKNRLNSLCICLKNINYFQWRTLHLQDGAFKKLEYDPQEITINNGKTILLPKEWDGGRLGHNRSILFVSGLIIDWLW